MKQKGFAPILIIVIFVAIGITGYISYKTFKKGVSNKISSSKSPSPSFTTENNDILKIRDKISIKLPLRWKYKECNLGEDLTVLSPEGKYLNCPIDSPGGIIDIAIKDQPNFIPKSQTSMSVTGKTKITIDGVDSVKQTVTFLEGPETGAVFEFVYIDNDKYHIQLTLYDKHYQKEFDNLLSSIKLY